MPAKLKRRIGSIGALSLITIAAIALFPLLALAVVVLSRSPSYRTAPHALLFLYGYLFFEWSGLCRLAAAYLTHSGREDLLEKARAIQFWWAEGLLRLGQSIYSLSIEVTGNEALDGRSAIVMPRHTSVGDTVLPLIFFAMARGEGLRYVIKKELLILPCIDICGNLLPNVFVDRSGQDTDKALGDIRDLVTSAGEDESVLIYPEGTRSSYAKRERLAETRPELAPLLQRWPDLLPPRLGGASAMLAANPGKDVVFVAHTGFEGSASLHDLISGGWRGQHVRIHLWRVPYADVPDDHRAFMLEQWDRMQATVDRLARGADG